MNFKKNWKRFFTVSRASEGFTLVELIVVIAILAILAGIAVPAYSGYIKKANKAADLQLLGAVNTAFAAACLENGHDVSEITGANMPLTGDEGSRTINTDNIQPAEYKDAFIRYFEGNAGTFKVITGLVWDNSKKSFCDVNDATEMTFVYGGGSVTVSAEVAQQLANSSFGQMGATNLTNQVGYVSDIASALLGLGSGTLNDIVYGNDWAYVENLKSSLGITEEEWAAMGESGLDLNDFLANSLVLNVAQNTEDIDTADLTTKLANGTLASNLLTLVNASDAATAQTGLAQTALAYGMYTSYLYNEKDGASTTIASMGELQEALADPDFQAYVTGAQAQSDLQAYVQALNVVNESTQSNEAAINVLTNGFTDPALVEILGQIMK